MAVIAALPALSSVATALAREAPRSISELIRVAEDLYPFRYDNHITMFIVTDEGVISAEPLGQQNPLAPEMLKLAIRSVTPQPV